MTRIRDQAVTVVNWLRLKGVDYDAITGQSTQDDYSVGETYDLQEFCMFLATFYHLYIRVSWRYMGKR
jgi:hypothetical protein